MNREKIETITERIEKRERIAQDAGATLQRTFTSEVNHFGREFIMRWRLELNRRLLINESMIQVLRSELQSLV